MKHMDWHVNHLTLILCEPAFQFLVLVFLQDKGLLNSCKLNIQDQCSLYTLCTNGEKNITRPPPTEDAFGWKSLEGKQGSRTFHLENFCY